MGVEDDISLSSGVYIMVDDTDPEILYDGPWSQDFGSTDSIGNAGSTYNHTTHVIRNNGSLSFTFTGTEFTAAASVTIRDVDAKNDPDWTCSVDGVALNTGGNNGIADANRYILCSNDSLPLGQHTVSIGVRSLGTPFWFDYIHYLPGPTVSNDSKIIIYDSLNQVIQYDGTWVNSPNSGAHMTQKNGGTLSVPFNGTSISWVGFALQSLPEGAAQAKYSLDLGSDVEFAIPTITPAEDSDEFQQTYFITPPVENGHHTLVVTYEGNEQTTPLMLDYFLVSTGPTIPNNTLGSSNSSVIIPGVTPLGGSGSSSAPLSSPSGQGQPGNSGGAPSQSKVVANVGAIVGGVVGGAAFAFIVAFTAFFLYRRRQRKQNLGEAFYHGVPYRAPDMIVSANDRVSALPIEPWVPPGSLPSQLATTIHEPSTSSILGGSEGSRYVPSQSESALIPTERVQTRKTDGTAPPGYSP